MAARRGDWQQLERLLCKKGDAAAAAAPQPVPTLAQHDDVVVHVEEPATDDAVDTAEVSISSVTAPAEAVTVAGDSVLHVVASRGDGEEFLESATVVYGKSSHLLGTRNKNGDTPLHCAARAGWGGMVTHLVALASAGNGDGLEKIKVKAILRMRNEQGETVLHEAVRLGDRDMVGRLITEDPQLARVPPADGASPLYLAVSLGHDAIARQLYDKDKALSYSGPGGRTALHVAVLKGKAIHWKYGSHFAASWGKREAINLLLEAETSAAYQPDRNESFPIHVAAFANRVKAVSVLLHGRHDCAELCDAKGRTFLHDKDGNTALHLAVRFGNLWIFNPLMKNCLVKLNLTNSKGQTLLDLSWIMTPVGVHYGLNPRIRVYKLLQDAGAQNGTYRWDLFHEEHIPKLEQKEEAQKITDSTQTIGIGSVLIATVAFAAAFALPGGYRADDHRNGGTPTLAEYYAFDVFIIANTLAFICSDLSITSLMYAGVAAVDIRTRMISFVLSATFMASSATRLGAAFAFGLCVVLAPVARTTAVASCAITALALVDVAWFIWVVGTGELMLLKRLGIRAWWRLAWAILLTLLQ
ncbi:hypothetical protein BRADI_4g28230v3 [Brachypodium distachyon]|uniref:PGG domain-containing protein n=1 Tax=Brachypodium distachyon TaxID=15368 RepID=A0A0Q3ER30_BRADI|nr:hypothetical protein BRADI_4g28230v3 [Brachypodium distachyon]